MSNIVNLAAFRDAKAKELDATDHRILRALRVARARQEPASFRQLGTMVGVTSDECSRRMYRMETLGFLKRRADLIPPATAQA
ncbi:AsnC family transcriptional regulator [Methylocella sp.]|jgi:DNA-binding Lrp family transcriptional regulator|uniref:AsnC family transcriptional regulator n=1 Tax=Methylocella sp. TaxID=1978226 RepID=UPI003C1321B9